MPRKLGHHVVTVAIAVFWIATFTVIYRYWPPAQIPTAIGAGLIVAGVMIMILAVIASPSGKPARIEDMLDAQARALLFLGMCSTRTPDVPISDPRIRDAWKLLVQTNLKIADEAGVKRPSFAEIDAETRAEIWGFNNERK